MDTLNSLTGHSLRIERSKTSFYGRHIHTDIGMKPPETISTAPTDDTVSSPVLLGDATEILSAKEYD